MGGAEGAGRTGAKLRFGNPPLGTAYMLFYNLYVDLSIIKQDFFEPFAHFLFKFGSEVKAIRRRRTNPRPKKSVMVNFFKKTLDNGGPLCYNIKVSNRRVEMWRGVRVV